MTPRVAVRASGVLPYRVKGGKLRVAIVHRPHYDDWSWAKGKLEQGEDWAAAAAREAFEETGLRVRLGLPLPDALYPVGRGLKRVRYWAATVIGGNGDLQHEIDEVLWLRPRAAARRLSYGHDKAQLDELVRLHRQGRLATWPLLVVRHAEAEARGSWEGPDPARPLTAAGQAWAQRLVSTIDAYEPVTVLTSPSVRCWDTIEPYARRRGLTLMPKKGLSEEGFAQGPNKLSVHADRLLASAAPAVICTHGPLLEPLLTLLRKRAAEQLDSGSRRMLARLAKVGLDKGEVLALTMSSSGSAARVVAIERHRPPAI
ncbi:MAG: NUDIX domain-containing protein [Ornithinimicrobium sp.]|uniref:NUDIX domain-containing protein n=1 Tax=Ornithinimicrobium sp. TaxID=1977084 RepID=UPI0026DEAF1B|nr:NUDIX domain-containing protein [Ornithinimicrobium sp.]MDO5740268.1 NUDIX domain-containing protein [Ornithinimicrobium sp.]